MVAIVHDTANYRILSGQLNLTSQAANLRLVVLSTAYTIDNDLDFYSQVSAHEVVDTYATPGAYSYTAGGKVPTNVAFGISKATNRALVTFDPVEWGPVTIANGRYGLLVHWTGVAGTSLIISSHDIGQTLNPIAGTMRLTPSVNGVLSYVTQ